MTGTPSFGSALRARMRGGLPRYDIHRRGVEPEAHRSFLRGRPSALTNTRSIEPRDAETNAAPNPQGARVPRGHQPAGTPAPGQRKGTGTVSQPFGSFFGQYPETLSSISGIAHCGSFRILQRSSHCWAILPRAFVIPAYASEFSACATIPRVRWWRAFCR